MQRDLMADKNDAALRKHLVEVLTGGHAHATFEQAVKGLPAEFRGKLAKGAEHTPWQLLEHLRIAQRDILEFSRNPKHVSPKWPEGYWPESAAPSTKADWTASVRSFRSDLKAMSDLIADPASDLTAPLPNGDGQTLLREALLVADHNSYHIGQLVFVRQLLGAWKS
jgi:DinB superfamily